MEKERVMAGAVSGVSATTTEASEACCRPPSDKTLILTDKTLILKRVCMVALFVFAAYLNWQACALALPVGAVIAALTDPKVLSEICDAATCSTLLLVDLSGTKPDPLFILSCNIAFFVSHALHDRVLYPFVAGAWMGAMAYRKVTQE